MGYKTDKVAPSPGLLGEWRYQTLTIGGKVAIALVAIVCLSTVPIFGIGVVLGLWSAIFFLVFFGQRTYRCVRVYPDRIEAISVWERAGYWFGRIKNDTSSCSESNWLSEQN